jgi:hypothetical protein
MKGKNEEKKNAKGKKEATRMKEEKIERKKEKGQK